MSDLIHALARRAVNRKRAGVQPYIVLLGAGASVSSGCRPLAELVDIFLRQYCPADCAKLEKKRPAAARHKAKLDRFYEEWRSLSNANRFAFLKEHLSGSPSPGYEHLSWLVREGYVRLIFSTNLDDAVEQAFTAASLVPNRDYEIMVNCRGAAPRVADRLRAPQPPIKLVKLHGTLSDEDSYAWLPEEVFEFEDELEQPLGEYLNGDLIILGNQMDDRDLDLHFRREGGEIWFVNPSGPRDSRFQAVLRVRAGARMIEGQEARFDDFLQALRSAVEAAETDTGATYGLRDIRQFLTAIGMPEQVRDPRSRYLRLPELFVEPEGYDEIITKLDRYRAVVIVGEPHMGKTYTAMHILWERFQQGWNVKHIRRDALVAELHRSGYAIDEFVSRNLRSRCLLHLDDPFGETEYQHLGVLQQDFARLVQAARRSDGCGLIVTSRQSVFYDAVQRMEGGRLLERMWLKADIRVHTSYSKPKLREVLRRYAQVYAPSWAANTSLKERVLEEVPAIMEAPHNLELFVRMSDGLSDELAVIACARNCREIVPAIRDWMLRLPHPEQLLLLITHSFADFPSGVYDRYAQGRQRADLTEIYRGALARAYRDHMIEGITDAAWESALRSLRDIVNLSGDDWAPLSFVHPSYGEAVDEALVASPGLGRLLLVAARYCTERDDDEVFRAIAADVLPRHVHLLEAGGTALLERLASDKSGLVRETLARSLAAHYDRVDVSERQVLARLAADEEPHVRGAVAALLAAIHNDLDKPGRELVAALSNDNSPGVRRKVSDALARQPELDGAGRELLTKFTHDESEDVRLALAESFGGCCPKMPPFSVDVLAVLTLDEAARVRNAAARALASPCEKITASGRKALAKLASHDASAVRSAAGRALGANYSALEAAERVVLYALGRDSARRVRAAVGFALAVLPGHLDIAGGQVLVHLRIPTKVIAHSD